MPAVPAPIAPIMPPPLGQMNGIPMKGKLPKAFTGKEGMLEKFLFKMEEYFDPYIYATDRNKISMLTAALDGLALDWWRKRRQTITTWEQAKQALLLQYGDKFIEGNSRRELEDLYQTGRIQDYLAEVERLNGHAGLSQRDVIALIYWKIKPQLRELMASHHELRTTTPLAWMNLLVLNGDAIEQNNRMRGYFDKCSSLKNDTKPNHKKNGEKPNHEKTKDKLAKTGKDTNDKPKGDWVSPELKRKRKKVGQCEKCGKSGHSFTDCTKMGIPQKRGQERQI